MAYYGIASNLVLYLTKELREGTVKSSNNVTNWVGTAWMTPILGAYIADTFLGRYWTFVIASAIYLVVINVPFFGCEFIEGVDETRTLNSKADAKIFLAVVHIYIYIYAINHA